MHTHVQKGHTVLHILYHSSTAQTFESIDAGMSISVELSEASDGLFRPKGKDNFDFSLAVDMGFALWKTSNRVNPGSTVSCRLEKLIQSKKQLNSPTLQYKGRTASPQC